MNKSKLGHHFAVLLVVVVLLLVIGFGAIPQLSVTKYELWVGGTRITSENAADVFGDNTVRYNVATNTLTLNNYTYKGEGVNVHSVTSVIHYTGIDVLTVYLTGINYVTHTGVSTEKYGIYSSSRELVITGNGSLTAAAESASSSVGINCTGNIVIKNGIVMAIGGEADGYTTSTSCGINCGGKLVVEGGALGASGGSAPLSYGVQSTGGVSIEEGAQSFVVSGESRAINGTVNSTVSGTGWTDTDGTSGEASVSASPNGTLLDNKRVRYKGATVSYDLWTGGVRVTNANAGNVFGDGTVRYDADANVLTLNGWTYGGAGTEHGDRGVSVLYTGSEKLTVELCGANHLTAPASGAWSGVFCAGDLSVRGTGSLTVEGKAGCDDTGILCVGDLTVDGGVLNMDAGAAKTGSAVVSSGSVVLAGGSLYAKARRTARPAGSAAPVSPWEKGSRPLP